MRKRKFGDGDTWATERNLKAEKEKRFRILQCIESEKEFTKEISYNESTFMNKSALSSSSSTSCSLSSFSHSAGIKNPKISGNTLMRRRLLLIYYNY